MLPAVGRQLWAPKPCPQGSGAVLQSRERQNREVCVCSPARMGCAPARPGAHSAAGEERTALPGLGMEPGLGWSWHRGWPGQTPPALQEGRGV